MDSTDMLYGYSKGWIPVGWILLHKLAELAQMLVQTFIVPEGWVVFTPPADICGSDWNASATVELITNQFVKKKRKKKALLFVCHLSRNKASAQHETHGHGKTLLYDEHYPLP